MATAGTTDGHERLQPVGDPSPHWSDSLYFNAWDPATDAFVMTRIAVQANAGRVTGGMLVWLDGEITYAYGRDLNEIPPTDWDVMSTDGLTYRMLESGQAWAVQLADDDTKAHLEWQGRSPATLYDEHPAGPLPQAVAWGHYEQTCAVRGDLVLGDRRIAFDGLGQRDHSWGFRHWAGLREWHWITGFLTDGRAFNLFEVLQHDGTTTRNGYVHRADGDHYVVSAERRLAMAPDGAAREVALTLVTDDGASMAVEGSAAGFSVPVRPADDQPVVVHETPMRLTVDGVPGYGIYEHLVASTG